MEEIPSLGSGRKIKYKYIFYAVGAIVVIAVLWMVIGSFSSNSINAYFDPSSTLNSGDSTTLIVELTNTYGQDLEDVLISVTAVDPTTIAVADSPQTESIFGNGETRRFHFPLTVGQGREGTYSLEIEVDFGTSTESLRTTLTIIA